MIKKLPFAWNVTLSLLWKKVPAYFLTVTKWVIPHAKSALMDGLKTKEEIV